ncbi:MAG: phage Gp37/Gp68 family protein [Pyramidobacter porci]|uniref:DUF5131 family protein n=1 Tax=Pyramidobacter porci TaxID=2605789 RepID=UPI002A74F724|nr:phage Gp37/Gp68 family protein [Pyramidobacter porci]MDY2648906.1 phage Gp37/Gp68 family protein [Pyramidobacter porci]
MAQNSAIEWTNATWNPLAGCTCVSEGCRNCYAMALAARLEAMGQEKYTGLTCKNVTGKAMWTGRIHFDASCLEKPLEWKAPQLIFVNSMSDLFHENATDDMVRAIWYVMRRAHWHTFQVLTKRPERMLDMITKLELPLLPNLWLGVSVENKAVVKRIDVLRKTPAALRFISFEPLIGAVGKVNLAGISWAIVGGESGPGARPMKEEWVDEIHAACTRYKTLFFFKQWGGVQKKKAGRLYKDQEWNDMPSPDYQKSV